MLTIRKGLAYVLDDRGIRIRFQAGPKNSLKRPDWLWNHIHTHIQWVWRVSSPGVKWPRRESYLSPLLSGGVMNAFCYTTVIPHAVNAWRLINQKQLRTPTPMPSICAPLFRFVDQNSVCPFIFRFWSFQLRLHAHTVTPLLCSLHK
jgi:hypothetical protein